MQLSRDATAIVFHDYHLGRLTSETCALARHSAWALSEVVLTGGQDTIPSLKQTLALVAGRVPLLIEIKDQDGNMGCNVGPLEEAVAAALESYDGDVAVMSFNPNAVAPLPRLALK